jgi:uncharacterized integral membrane protein
MDEIFADNVPELTDIVTDDVRDAAEEGARKGARGRRGPSGLVAVISSVLGAILAIFAIQNLDSTDVNFLAWTIELPLAATIGIAFAFGAVIASLLGWRRRRSRAKG